MKYNETVNKKVTEVREDECQTDEQEQKYPSSIGEGQVVIDRYVTFNFFTLLQVFHFII